MTGQQKDKIREMREQGCGYTKIASFLGISENTVKSYCRRNNLTGTFGASVVESESQHTCLLCGKPVLQNPGRKEKKFCSAAHRQEWWNSHKFLINPRTAKEYACPTCHKVFRAYEHAHRKYCSHSCYIKGRFGGEADD